jgi:non-ribosomal peptide synthetase component E (peptide arylation enzyme)
MRSAGGVPAAEDYKAPDEVVVIDALPLTAMMKVDKAALRMRVNR